MREVWKNTTQISHNQDIEKFKEFRKEFNSHQQTVKQILVALYLLQLL